VQPQHPLSSTLLCAEYITPRFRLLLWTGDILLKDLRIGVEASWIQKFRPPKLSQHGKQVYVEYLTVLDIYYVSIWQEGRAGEGRVKGLPQVS
jgi:hypothetical protein